MFWGELPEGIGGGGDKAGLALKYLLRRTGQKSLLFYFLIKIPFRNPI